MRKNIFEILQGKREYLSEIKRIEDLLEDKRGVEYAKKVGYGLSRNPDYYEIKSLVNNCAFKIWKQRGTCIDCDDMRDKLGLTELIENDDEDDVDEFDFLLYLEFAANIVFLITLVDVEDDEVRIETDIETTIKKNIEICLNWFNYETKLIEEEEKVLVVEKSPATTAVAEIVDKDLSIKVIEYNHFLLKGNIDKKKQILKALGDNLEPKRPKLEEINKSLAKNIFMMLNKMNIRHNNVDESDKSNYVEYVAKLSSDELENWYDELYQLMLLAILELDNVERTIRINTLRSEIAHK